MFFEDLFFSFPYPMRRFLYSKLKPVSFNRMQRKRILSTDDGYTFKPFDLYKCIFIHIPKAAGISVSKSLFGNLCGGHTSVMQYQLIFSQQEFNQYFKFTFVRNPWDRVFSAYHFLKRGGIDHEDREWANSYLASYNNFEEFILYGLKKSYIQKYIHFVPQIKFLQIPGHKKLLVDFLGFFENIQEDFRIIQKRLKLEGNSSLLHENPTMSKAKLKYSDHYTDAMKNVVAKVYRADIKSFGYSFDNSSIVKQIENRDVTRLFR